MEFEIHSLLSKLQDVNDAMSRCATSPAPTTTISQKLERDRDILHEFTQVSSALLSLVTLVSIEQQANQFEWWLAHSRRQEFRRSKQSSRRSNKAKQVAQ
jgi:hypothetical protein